MEEFLKIEYERCLDLLKYYDERHLSLVKFATGTTSSIISLIFGFHALSPGVSPYFCVFRSKPATDSVRRRPPIPVEAGH